MLVEINRNQTTSRRPVRDGMW